MVMTFIFLKLFSVNMAPDKNLKKLCDNVPNSCLEPFFYLASVLKVKSFGRYGSDLFSKKGLFSIPI